MITKVFRKSIILEKLIKYKMEANFFIYMLVEQEHILIGAHHQNVRTVLRQIPV